MGDLLTTTTSNQLSTLDQKISSATDLLIPASEDAIASAIIKLASCGLPFPTGIDPTNAARVYQFALRGVAREAIKRVVVRIVQGDVPTVREFLPAPPALAALCKAEARELWTDRERLLATKEALEFKPAGGQKTEEAKAKVRAMVQAVKDQAAADRSADKDAFYNKPEDELNRIFRNKVFPPDEPAAGKWDDDAWHSQQRKNENGEENIGSQGLDQGELPGGPEERGERHEGDGSVYGFEGGSD